MTDIVERLIRRAEILEALGDTNDDGRRRKAWQIESTASMRQAATDNKQAAFEITNLRTRAEKAEAETERVFGIYKDTEDRRVEQIRRAEAAEARVRELEEHQKRLVAAVKFASGHIASNAGRNELGYSPAEWDKLMREPYPPANPGLAGARQIAAKELASIVNVRIPGKPLAPPAAPRGFEDTPEIVAEVAALAKSVGMKLVPHPPADDVEAAP
jgi:hypothetical protein